MNKTAIVTGAGRGIGASIALRLAKDGFNLALNDLNEEALFETAKLCKDLGAEAECFPADVSNHDECEEFVKKIKTRFGTIDVLVNNAGITRDGLLARMSEENYDLVIAVNQKSVFNMMKHCCAVMMKQRSGRVINVSSVIGLYGNAGQLNYAASKAAVIGMTKSAAKEFGSRGIAINAIAPGFIQTPMTDALTEEQKNAILSMVAMKRYGTVDEVSGVVSFLASNDAGYITGQTIEISGGLSM